MELHRQFKRQSKSAYAHFVVEIDQQQQAGGLRRTGAWKGNHHLSPGKKGITSRNRNSFPSIPGAQPKANNSLV